MHKLWYDIDDNVREVPTLSEYATSDRKQALREKIIKDKFLLDYYDKCVRFVKDNPSDTPACVRASANDLVKKCPTMESYIAYQVDVLISDYYNRARNRWNKRNHAKFLKNKRFANYT